MLKQLVITAIAIASIAPAASAQSDLSTWGGAMIQSGQASTMAYANSRGHRDERVRATRSNRTAQTCANAARMHARGSSDPKLVRLRQLCRQAGY